MVQSSPGRSYDPLLRILVVIDTLQEQGEGNRIVKETAMTVAVAGAKTGHGDQSLHACRLHGID